MLVPVDPEQPPERIAHRDQHAAVLVGVAHQQATDHREDRGERMPVRYSRRSSPENESGAVSRSGSRRRRRARSHDSSTSARRRPLPGRASHGLVMRSASSSGRWESTLLRGARRRLCRTCPHRGDRSAAGAVTGRWSPCSPRRADPPRPARASRGARSARDRARQRRPRCSPPPARRGGSPGSGRCRLRGSGSTRARSAPESLRSPHRWRGPRRRARGCGGSCRR